MLSLPRTVVGLDIETTALDPAAGEIIEVVAIRYDLATGEEIKRFERLCAASTAVSLEITVLTGITSEMIAGQQPFSDIRGDLASFVGQDYILAHNAQFDLKWLARHGLALSNPVWDTFPLAAVVWPQAASYNLGMLACQLGMEIKTEHRAAADVALTWQIFKRLRQELVVTGVLPQVRDILEKGNLGHYQGLFSGRRSSEKRVKPTSRLISRKKTFNLEDVLGENAILKKSLPHFSSRLAQQQMARAVEQAIEHQETIFIEAGTGTGKTFGYLVPLLLRLQSDTNARAYISTYTRNLQDQLFSKDLPTLLVSLSSPVQVAILKGRRNYVCRRRLESYLRKGSFSSEEAWALIKTLVWLGNGGNGDLEQLNFSHQDERLLTAIHADHVICRQNCSVASGCPYQFASQRAAQAQLVIINHALLLQMGQSSQRRQARALVIDEAHHLEEAVRGAAMVDFTPQTLAGIVAAVCQKKLARDGNALLKAYQEFLAAAASIIQSQAAGRGRLLLTRVARGGSGWHKVASAGQDWLASFKLILGRAQAQSDQDSFTDAQQFVIQFEQFLAGSSERIQWIEVGYKNMEAQLCDTALSVKAYIEGVKQFAPAIILTSATLETNGTMAYIKSNLGWPEAKELILASPYSNSDQMLIYIVDDGADPTGSSFDSYTAKIIEHVARILSGRLLALFTSHKGLKSVYKGLISSLRDSGIKLLAQELTGGRASIGSRFRDVHASVLLGTNSFWEGIDVPGESLSAVVIPKLPFPAIDDPVLLTLGEQEGRASAFDAVTMPHMLLRLRQGVGRLIRTESDRGVVIMLDRRVVEKYYGQAVFRSLPAATVEVGSYKNLPAVLTQWFGHETLARWKKMKENK